MQASQLFTAEVPHQSQTVNLSRRQRHEVAGRAFKSTYEGLTRGDKASLRHEDVTLQRSFWTCLNAARKSSGLQASSPELEKSLELMIPLFALKHLQGVNPKHGKNIGELMQHPALKPRRVECVMSEFKIETLCEQIESISTIAKLSLDYGVMLADLIDFHWEPGQVRRAWARSLYLEFTSVDISAARRATT